MTKRSRLSAHQKLQPTNLSKQGPVIVADIMAAADEKKLGCPVAQHLVRAKLARRFPNKKIDNFRCTAADAQLGRDGDFTVENTAFHVTVAPTLAQLEQMRGERQARQETGKASTVICGVQGSAHDSIGDVPSKFWGGSIR